MTADAPEPTGRWRLLADLLTFQVKLFVDGLRDLVMVPISLVAGLIGLLTRRDDPGRYFYDALRWGKDTERWIDLFGALRHDATREGPGFDDWVRKVETVVADQYEKGGITRRAKDGIDDVLDRLHSRREGADE